MPTRITYLDNLFPLTTGKSNYYPESMKNSSYKRVPNALREHREKLGLTQKMVANKLGLRSITLISRWESGDILPSLVNAFRLANLYQTSIEALFPAYINITSCEGSIVTSLNET